MDVQAGATFGQQKTIWMLAFPWKAAGKIARTIVSEDTLAQTPTIWPEQIQRCPHGPSMQHERSLVAIHIEGHPWWRFRDPPQSQAMGAIPHPESQLSAFCKSCRRSHSRQLFADHWRPSVSCRPMPPPHAAAFIPCTKCKIMKCTALGNKFDSSPPCREIISV